MGHIEEVIPANIHNDGYISNLSSSSYKSHVIVLFFIYLFLDF